MRASAVGAGGMGADGLGADGQGMKQEGSIVQAGGIRGWRVGQVESGRSKRMGTGRQTESGIYYFYLYD